MRQGERCLIAADVGSRARDRSPDCLTPAVEQRGRAYFQTRAQSFAKERTMDKVAKVSTVINAAVTEVWDALVNPEQIKKYMFGAQVVSSWKEGSPITWKGEWKGKSYEDKGEILAIAPERKLQYSHYSPLTGQPDTPENYHTVTIELSGKASTTAVTLSQDNNPTEDAKAHSEKNWSAILDGLKKVVEH
jgi:uncharacterized protein YndB with AHSA1/START domain